MDGDDLAGQKLETQIVINARTGNGFLEVGNTLTELGSLVNGVSQQLLDFGKESINVYKDYEKSMKDAEVALSTTYGRNTKELSQIMGLLDSSATEWAATTIFHTNDVANAISEAAHAGWDYEQIMSGIPAAMQLAQAGSIDLSTAVDYIVKSVNAAGIEFDDTSRFIDLWTFAANSSASSIEEFGEAMLRMGSTMRFTDSTEELMTLLSVTANAGSTGSEAGTLIRNSIIRLIAPTKTAKEAMAQLGATSEETAGIMDDAALSAANARLEAQGFSAFDENNQLKGILDIYRELYVALGEINGGYQDIEENGDVIDILSAIFPTRTITEAMTLLRGAADNYDDLYDSMKKGAAEGYGAYAAETMMDTLYGRMETFESKVERLKQMVGEELADPASTFLGMAGDFIDAIAEMDEGKFSALVSGLTAIAVTGPGLIAAGGVLRLIGTLLSPGGAIALGTVGVVALSEALTKLEEVNLENQFGLADIDREAINSYVRSIGDSFRDTYSEVDKFRTAVDESVTSYQTASQTFTGDLLTSMITGATLTDADIANLNNLGDQMHSAVMSGIQSSRSESISYFQLLFGGSISSNFDSDYRNIASITNDSFSESIAEAESIGQQIRDAMTAAFADGKINDEEYAKIQSYVNSYNEALTQASNQAKDEQDYINRQMLLHRAQTASLEELQGITEEITTERDKVLGEAEDVYLRQRYGLEYRYDQAIANGTSTTAERDSSLEALDKKYNEQRINQSSKYDDLILSAWNSQIGQSQFSDIYGFLSMLSTDVMAGNQSPNTATSTMKSTFGGNKYAGDFDFLGNNIRSQLSELLQQEIVALGGYDDIFSKIQNYENSGNYESAQSLRNLFAMQQINDKGYYAGTTLNDEVRMTAYPDFIQGASHSFTVTPVFDTSGIAPIPVPIEPHMEGQDSVTALQEQGVEVQVEGDVQQLQATIDGEDGKTLLQYVDGDVTDLSMKIQDENGQTLVENVTGDASSLAAVINSYRGKTITVNIAGRRLFAEGGRATTASIFGEAGPEWAIPEEHTQRTADLLDAAREASGFTWGDLMERTGVLSTGKSNPSTIIYSPTVYANNAEGVDDALLKDKKRLNDWYEDMKMRDEMEVYR